MIAEYNGGQPTVRMKMQNVNFIVIFLWLISDSKMEELKRI